MRLRPFGMEWGPARVCARLLHASASGREPGDALRVARQAGTDSRLQTGRLTCLLVACLAAGSAVQILHTHRRAPNGLSGRPIGSQYFIQRASGPTGRDQTGSKTAKMEPRGPADIMRPKLAGRNSAWRPLVCVSVGRTLRAAQKC